MIAARTRWSLVVLLAAIPLIASAALGQATPPMTLQNGDFEQVVAGSVPSGWKVTTGETEGRLSTENPAQGNACAFVECTSSATDFCNLMQKLDAAPYRGKRIRYSAQVKHTGEPGKAQLWLRVDRPGKVVGFFDNMEDRPVVRGEWAQYEISGQVDDDAETVNLGIFVVGGGKGWIDDARLEVLPPAPEADAPPREPGERGLANLVAFARLFGYVRHFHPSDEAVAADWMRLAMAGVESVEGATDAAQLAASLRAFFAPLAPSLFVAMEEPPPDHRVPAGATQWASWRHEGYGQETKEETRFSPYISRVVRETIESEADERNGTMPGTTITLDLGEGIRARVPIGVYADAVHTLPKAEGTPPALDRPEGWIPSGDDRTTRLADVILAWNVLQHFYPYFDVVQTDWPGALRQALRRAAVDPDETGFRETLERLAAALHDGHGFVKGPGMLNSGPPVRWEWVGRDLVITVTPGDSISSVIRAGDVVEAIDGRPTADLMAELAPRIPAATEQWRRWRSVRILGATPGNGSMRLRLRHPDGSAENAVVPTRAGGSEELREPRPPNGAVVAPGILYCNLVGAEMDSIAPLLPKLAAAKGVIFDLRGYPASAGRRILPHLCTGQIQSANWNVPLVTLPDGRGVTYQTSRWVIEAEEPHIGGRVVYITTGRAISYAESCLGIIEHYKLAEIVGGPTAGTNGNVAQIALPGGYGINFTGMQVIKQDGSRHHGVGILPTVPVERTIRGIAEGRDELLEKAIEVASGSR